MKNKEEEQEKVSTEDKIKDAAKRVFQKKGFAATRTRDIAEEAGLNLSLLNYYFRSKEKLFELIVLETIFEFAKSLIIVLNDEDSSIIQKVEIVADRYIDFIKTQPDLPIFILSESRFNIGKVMENLPIKEFLSNSVLVRQLKEKAQRGEMREVNYVHFIMNVMGLIIFPFIAQPIIMGGTSMSSEEFIKMMEERKVLIPIWVEAMFKANKLQ
ncbi:TetR/AcrR family transcriptional regulator [Sphingobacterium kyonggiense]|uniref:TetR/AcrR family transcriptional regulator n=1 Tax=Sphingobacterium kyonggiense TaxID=714075 RepID=A0ABP7YK63_9SPHI